MLRLYRRQGVICAAAILAVSLILGVSSAGAVTIGQLAPNVPPEDSCSDSPYDLLQPTVISGTTMWCPQPAVSAIGP